MKPLVVALLIVTACSSTRRDAAREPRRTPVVIAIVVDQFAAWIASERLSELPPTGGFARLLREGTYVRAIRYAHAATETAPGHAALYTGAPPSRTGVLSNEALEGDRIVSTLQDDNSRLVLLDGVSDRPGASPRVLRVEGLGDVFRKTYPQGYIAGLSLKDRGAILPVGRAPNAAIWLDVELGQLASSTYYGQTLPPWSKDIAASLESRLSTPWTVLDPDWVRAHAVSPDDQPGEEPNMRTFPHDLMRTMSRGNAVRVSPTGNDVLVDLALAAIDSEYTPGRPTFIAVSFSTNDLVGHTFGPDSWESWDQLLRLDGSLARFFDELDKRFGKDGYAIALSADHGVASLPEVQPHRPECASNAKADRWDRACTNLARVSRSTMAVELADTARRTLGDGRYLYGFVGAFVALTPEGRAAHDTLVPALIARLEQRPEVAKAIDVHSFPSPCPEGDGLEALACHAYPPDSSGDILVVLKRGYGFGGTSGASHGMPYTYDLTVPFLVRAPGAIHAGRVIDDELPFATFTRTVAKLLEVPVPAAASDGRVLD